MQPHTTPLYLSNRCHPSRAHTHTLHSCPTCNTSNKVFETNALAHLNDAKVGATKLAVTSQAYVEKQIQELKSVPAHVPCAHCKLELGVPAEIFNWCCEGCKVWHDHTHATDKICPDCSVVRSPENSTPPQLRCPQCAEVTVVPYSNAAKHVSAAKVATKEAYGTWRGEDNRQRKRSQEEEE